MPIVRLVVGRRSWWMPLLLITSFSINGCQSPANRSEESVGSYPRWKVTGQVGRVSLRTPGQPFWQKASPGVAIVPGGQVATFEGSRLELASAGDEVTASGRSRFTLLEAERDGVRVRQDAGTLRYRVQSAPKRRFEVKTPHFSTVVKGTSFQISTDRAGSEVFVDEGRVSILDGAGRPLAEVAAGQTGRMAARPGATLDVGTARGPSLEPSVGPGAERDRPTDDSATFSQPATLTSGSLGLPLSAAGEPTAEPSLLERIGGVLGAMAAQISPGDGLTGEGANLGDDRGGGAREQESWSKAHRQVDDGGDDGKGNGNDKGKGKGKGGEGKGNGKGKGGEGKGNGMGQGHGKGEGHGKGQGHGRGKADGGGANILPDRDEPRYLIGWNGHP